MKIREIAEITFIGGILGGGLAFTVYITINLFVLLSLNVSLQDIELIFQSDIIKTIITSLLTLVVYGVSLGLVISIIIAITGNNNIIHSLFWGAIGGALWGIIADLVTWHKIEGGLVILGIASGPLVGILLTEFRRRKQKRIRGGKDDII